MKNSGQATMEMTLMLIAFTMLILGIIFTCGLEISNNTILLAAKHGAEKAAAADSSGNVGAEFLGWEFHTVEGSSIPFTNKDRALMSQDSSISGAAYEMDAPLRSSAANYTYSWPGNAFDAHAEQSYLGFSRNAYDLAQLVRGGDPEDSDEPVYTLRHHPGKAALFEAMARWCGVRLDSDTLKNNPSNQVYIPKNKIK